MRYVPVHVIASSIDQQKSKALLAFHSFTGCDQTSLFARIGHKTAWEAWAIYDEVTEVFQSLSTALSISAVTEAVPVLERYTVLMYHRTSTCTTVSAARKDLFTCKGRDIESIPPTADALLQQAKRATYQAGHCWGKCLEVSPQLPHPSEWGWERGPNQSWEPLWTTIPRASQSCQELLMCKCRSERGCTVRSNCHFEDY